MRIGARGLSAVAVAAVVTVLATSPASASTVQIQDDANVLNVTTVQNDAAALPVGFMVWTTTQDAANRSAFDADVQARVTSQYPVVLGINTQSHHEVLRIGSHAGISPDEANSLASNVNQSFDSVMRAKPDYTGAVVAAINTLRDGLPTPGGRHTGGHGTSSGPGATIIGLIIGLIVIVAIVGLLRRGFRRRTPLGGMPGGGMPMGGGFQPGYGQGPYGPPPGYGPGYGGYGGGMGAGTAGVAGAVGGGLVGYELGKLAGENEMLREERRERDDGWGNDNQNYGGGDQGNWVVGQDSDFGGGDSGGGDWGGGDSGGGGGDW